MESKKPRRKVSMTERRAERNRVRKEAKKDMVGLIEHHLKMHEKMKKNMESDLKLFKSKNLSVGDFSYHKSYGKCLITDLRRSAKMLDQENNIRWIAEIATVHGNHDVDYTELVKPGPALEVLFEESN